MKKILKKINERFNYNLTIKLNGKKFIIPIVKNIGIWHFRNRDGFWLINLLKSLLNGKKGTFVDIGANIGQTLLALRSITDDIEYIGFEPNPTCVFYDRLLVQKNGLKKCRVIGAGLYSENTLMEFDLIGDADPGGSMVKELRPGYVYNEKLTVPVFSFDSILGKLNISSINIVKIDVEGAELEVIKCLKETVAKYKPVIIAEVLWTHNESTKIITEKRNSELFSILTSLDYNVYQIIKSKNNNNIVNLSPIPEFQNLLYTSENRDLCDYLFTPSDFDINLLTQ